MNIRVEDWVRDQLKSIADAEGVNVSEYVRDLVMAAIFRVHESKRDHGDQPAPESMRLADRQTLSLLHRILGRVLPPAGDDVDGDESYQLERARILEAGYTGKYWREVAAFRPELSKQDCGQVLDILDMYRVITFSIQQLEKDGATVSDSLRSQLQFKGFDFNDGLEGHMASYVEFLRSDGRWSQLQPHVDGTDDGNSHSLMLDTYKRMLAEHRRIKSIRDRGYH